MSARKPAVAARKPAGAVAAKPAARPAAGAKPAAKPVGVKKVIMRELEVDMGDAGDAWYEFLGEGQTRYVMVYEQTQGRNAQQKVVRIGEPYMKGNTLGMFSRTGINLTREQFEELLSKQDEILAAFDGESVEEE